MNLLPPSLDDVVMTYHAHYRSRPGLSLDFETIIDAGKNFPAKRRIK